MGAILETLFWLALALSWVGLTVRALSCPPIVPVGQDEPTLRRGPDVRLFHDPGSTLLATAVKPEPTTQRD